MRRTTLAIIAILALIAIVFSFSIFRRSGESAVASPYIPDSNDGDNSDISEVAEPIAASFEEMSLLDNDICHIVLTNYEPQSSLGAGFRAIVENKSEYHLTISANSVVNGFACHPTWDGQKLGDFYLQVEKGETVNSFLYWKPDNLADNDISNIETVDLTLVVTENDGGHDISQRLYEFSVPLPQSGEDNSSASVNIESAQTILAQADRFTVSIKDYDPDTSTYTLCFENHSNERLKFELFIIVDNYQDTWGGAEVKPDGVIYQKLILPDGANPTLEVREREFAIVDNSELYLDGDIVYSETVSIPTNDSASA